MNKKYSRSCLVLIIGILIVGCTAPATQIEATLPPTSIPLTATMPATATETQPESTATPTSLPTAIATPINAIQHFATGQEFTVGTIDMIDANRGWAIGGLGEAKDHVLLTSDGGSTWRDITPPEEIAVSGESKSANGYFMDTQAAWVIYSNPIGTTPASSVVWRTEDAGATWQASKPLDLSGLNEFYNPSNLQFSDEEHGWLMVHVGVGMNHDYIVLFRTNDGGLSWERLIDPYNDTTGIMACVKTGMLFTDATHGWLTGDCNGVAAGVLLFKTSDAGSSWQTVDLPDPTNEAGLFSNLEAACGSYDPFFFGNDVGHIGVKCMNYGNDPITYQYYVFTTGDGGNTWQDSINPGESLYYVTENQGWSLSTKIWLTADGGFTWTTIADVSWTADLDFIDMQNGWGVAKQGDQLALVKTTDGGRHWSMLTPTVGD